jgi:hypothetical protein
VRSGWRRGGTSRWATSDSPWAHLVDHARFGEVLQRVRSVQPTTIFSSHLPAASGSSLDHFLEVLRTVPDADPFVPPSHEESGHLVAAMTADGRQVGSAT